MLIFLEKFQNMILIGNQLIGQSLSESVTDKMLKMPKLLKWKFKIKTLKVKKKVLSVR